MGRGNLPPLDLIPVYPSSADYRYPILPYSILYFFKYKFLIYLHVGSLQIIDLGPICIEKTCLGRRVTFLPKLPQGTKLFLHFHFYLQGKPFMRNTKLVWLEVTPLTVKPGHLLVIVGSTSQLGQLFLI